MNNATVSENQNWQQQTIEKLLLETLKEQKRKRRWSIIFKIIILLYLALLLLLLFPSKTVSTGDSLRAHTALIDIDGTIFPSADASAKNIIKSLDKALANTKTQAVIFNINSPGGSPVQANQIYNEIMRQRKLHQNIKIYAVCNDICASAAYYIASASTDIYADPSSLVGSIGVLMNSFGFVEAMKKIGVERRLYTAGDEKGFLDPFSPEKPQDIQIAQTMLDSVHQQFINKVKEGRGTRLKDSPELFSGLAWTGTQAMDLGLIDGFGSVQDVARDVVKNTNIVNYTYKPGYFEKLSERFGTSFSQALVSELSSKFE